jgi:microcin C transport system substrate-binding protein
MRAAALALLGLLAAAPAAAEPRHGFAVLGELKYGPDFKHFDYVDPNAPKGGETVLWYQGSFDSLNPFILKGAPAAGHNPFLVDGNLLTFESLMVAAADEAGSYYGLVAETVDLPEDRGWVEFTLRPQAKFHDGSMITAEDVAFSFDTLKKEGHPTYGLLLRDVVEAQVLTPRRIRFVFRDGALTRDLPAYVATLPILSKAWYATREFGKASMEPPMASGAYRVGEVEAGRFIVYERVPGWWADRLPVNVGRWNFARIKYDYYRDREIALEALFARRVDFREEYTARDWATKYDVPAVRDGRLKRETLPDETPSGTQAFFFNQRREKFADPRVRQALNWAFDFEWTNKTLFYGQYERSTSIFENSDLAAKAPPTPAEIALLEPFRDRLAKEAFEKPYEPPTTDGSGNIRSELRKAGKLLAEAGWKLKGGRLVDAKGEPFEIEFIIDTQGFERIILPYVKNLERLGIAANLRLLDSAQYVKRVQTFDFDVATARFSGSLTPGVEQLNRWSSEAVSREGSQNLAGIADPMIDALLDKLIGARDRTELVTAARALDRAVMWGHHLVPQWFKGSHTIAYWDRYARPKVKPKYDLGFLDTWWLDEKKQAALGR